jgi:hypothetical protein
MWKTERLLSLVFTIIAGLSGAFCAYIAAATYFGWGEPKMIPPAALTTIKPSIVSYWPSIGWGILALAFWAGCTFLVLYGAKKGAWSRTRHKFRMPNLKAEYYQGEARHLAFQVTLNGRPLDLTNQTLALMVKKDDMAIISKANADFDKSLAAKGRVSVFLTPADLALTGSFKGQIRVEDTKGVIRKGQPFDLDIKPSIIGQVRNLTTTCVAVSVTSDVEMQIN